MILGFSTKWDKRMGELAGEPNYFINKIWRGFDKDILPQHGEFYRDHYNRFGKPWDEEYGVRHRPKIHTLRHDPHNRWHPGRDIHFTINNRTKNSFRFAPVVKCTAVQYLDIEKDDGITNVYISNREDRADQRVIYYQSEDANSALFIGEMMMLELAQNDGFDSIDHFFRYFNESCQLKLIHWTDKIY